MLRLRQEGRTGTLAITSDGTRTFVYFKSGIPVDAEDSGIEPMGRMLVRLGVLTGNQYRDVLGKMTEVLIAGHQIRFGEAAVELGVMTEAQVAAAVHEQARWRVARCFQRETLSWTFEDGDIPDTVGDFPMTVEGLVYIAMLWLDGEGRGALGLSDAMPRAVSVSVAGRAQLACDLALTAELRDFLYALNGAHTVEQLVGDPPDDPRREALICALLLLGALRVHHTPQTARTSESPRAVVPLRASQRPARVDRQKMERVFSRVAKVALPNAALFMVPSTPLEHRLLAEHAFQRGQELLQRGDRSTAETKFRRAVQLAPKCNEYAIYALWCEVPEPLQARHPVLLLLKRTASSALREDPNFAFGHYVIGCVAMAAGELATARRSLQRAVTLDPANTKAVQYLEIVEDRLDQASPAS